MSLFQNTVIQNHLARQDTAQIEEKWAKYQALFHDPVKQANIRQSKEEQYQEGFFRDLFADILGHTINPDPDWNLITEQKNKTNAKKADGAIWYEGKIIAVIELKDTKTANLQSVEPQAFGYKNNQEGCRYVVIANFEKLRFYIDNTIEHIEFNLFTLTREQFGLLWLCLERRNLESHLPARLKSESLSAEEAVTRRLYQDYSQFKRELFADLCTRNPGQDPLELFKKSQKLLDRFLFILFAEDCGLLPPNEILRMIANWEKLCELDAYTPLYERIKKYFGYLDTGRKNQDGSEIFAYNGGLFKADQTLDSLQISDQILAEHLPRLAGYDFASEIDVNILGHIFENSLNEIDEIKARLNGQNVEKAQTKRKKDGVYYTPRYITRHIVAHTLGALCKNKKSELHISADRYQYTKPTKENRQELEGRLKTLETYRAWLLQLTICDPACGSGAFLNEALNFLIAEHRMIDELTAQLAGGSIVYQDIENSILENNLYGADINEESVEIAKLSLWLRTAQPRRKLSGLSGNIKCGNSLIADSAIAGAAAFDWKKEFPQVFENGGFDVIIGNPPYVKLEQIKAQSEQLACAGFATYEKRGDLYVLFVEQGFRLLASDGLISYIMPNKWLQAGYGKPLRRLFSQQHLHSLIDFGDVQIFEGATTYPCIFTAGKRQPENTETAAAGRILASDKTSAAQETSDTSIRPTPSENTAPVGRVSTRQENPKRTDGGSRPTLPAARTVAVSTLQTALAADFDENVRRNCQYFPADSFGEDTWIISSQQGSGLLGRLKEKFPTLKDFIGGEAYYGMKPGLSEAFFIDEETKNRLIKEDPNSAEIIKPMLRGRDISRYQNNFADVYMLFVPWHFPLHLDNSIAGASLEAEAAFSKQYPAVYKHLLQFKEKLADRNKSEVGIRYEWYALQRWAANYWQEFSKPKIMYQAFQVKPCFIYDESGLHCNNSMWIMPSENKGLLAVLNSKMGWWLVSQYCTQIQNGYQLIWQYFGQIPMPAPTAELAAQADTLLRLTAALHTVRQNLLDELGLEKIPAKLQQFELLDLDGFTAELAKAKKLKFADKLAQREFKQQWQRIFEQDKAAVLDLQTKIAAADQAADQMVYQLYELTEDEIRLIENP